ncbi:la protein 1 [Salvia hispanica]|uniref:la protein 1 n=1 Tax=Salvia hispanica TaxID=49212 RepID=UPI0020095F88|nr:la protein 1 [Salvia hispanica]
MAPLDDETAKKVIRQVEFYFSDSNLPRDKFLMKTISESDDGRKKVGRVTEIAKPEEVIEQLDDRTIGASPLEYDVQLEHVESFFSQYAKCGGCCKCFKANPELELKPRKEYDDERAKQEEVAKTRNQVGSNRKETNNAEPDYPKGLIVAFTMKSMSAENSTKQTGNHKQLRDDVSMKDDGDQEKTQVDSEETKKDAPEDVIDATNIVENAEKDEEKDADANGADTEVRQSEDNEKSEDIPKQERITLAACKDNKDFQERI